jgi:hypothetical protein
VETGGRVEKETRSHGRIPINADEKRDKGRDERVEVGSLKLKN